jgi:hypothetical protein
MGCKLTTCFFSLIFYLFHLTTQPVYCLRIRWTSKLWSMRVSRWSSDHQWTYMAASNRAY